MFAAWPKSSRKSKSELITVSGHGGIQTTTCLQTSSEYFDFSFCYSLIDSLNLFLCEQIYYEHLKTNALIRPEHTEMLMKKNVMKYSILHVLLWVMGFLLFHPCDVRLLYAHGEHYREMVVRPGEVEHMGGCY